MFAGVRNNTWTGLPLFVLAMAAVGLAWWVASPFTIRPARLVQRTGEFMVGWIKGLAEWWDPNAQLTERDISPHFWPNGTMPNSAEFEVLLAEQFDHYRLRVGGLVEAPREFSFSDLKALPKQEQITNHFCIQGWSGVAKWGGVPMRDILDIVKPVPDARYAVFYSFSEGCGTD
jgi:methionine sulfoxide reductase catalytic subunit